jgi:hypothetical protein
MDPLEQSTSRFHSTTSIASANKNNLTTYRYWHQRMRHTIHEQIRQSAVWYYVTLLNIGCTPATNLRDRHKQRIDIDFQQWNRAVPASVTISWHDTQSESQNYHSKRKEKIEVKTKSKKSVPILRQLTFTTLAKACFNAPRSREVKAGIPCSSGAGRRGFNPRQLRRTKSAFFPPLAIWNEV